MLLVYDSTDLFIIVVKKLGMASFRTSSTPSFGKLEKQFEEFRHSLEEFGSIGSGYALL